MKILIPDTQGSRISASYRQLFPRIHFRGIDAGEPLPEGLDYHPHGAWCGWLAAAPLQAQNIEAEIVFLQMFDADGAILREAVETLPQVLAAEAPDYVSMSSGAWDHDDYFVTEFMRQIYAPLGRKLDEIIEAFDILAFFASGNNDRLDCDNDTDFPQRLMDRAINVGSRNLQGIPSKFSGDGHVHYTMLGENVLSQDMHGTWTAWNGTSACAPKLCGVAAANGIRRHTIDAFLTSRASRPNGDWTLPHPKWGYGDVEHLWQHAVRNWMPNANNTEPHLDLKVY